MDSISMNSTHHRSKIVEKKKKNPESSEMQNLNVLYIGNDLPSIYMVFPASDIAFTFYQVL